MLFVITSPLQILLLSGAVIVRLKHFIGISLTAQ